MGRGDCKPVVVDGVFALACALRHRPDPGWAGLLETLREDVLDAASSRGRCLSFDQRLIRGERARDHFGQWGGEGAANAARMKPPNPTVAARYAAEEDWDLIVPRLARDERCHAGSPGDRDHRAGIAVISRSTITLIRSLRGDLAQTSWKALRSTECMSTRRRAIWFGPTTRPGDW
jgi:hypothetical protein